jgi:hypothetical protein
MLPALSPRPISTSRPSLVIRRLCRGTQGLLMVEHQPLMTLMMLERLMVEHQRLMMVDVLLCACGAGAVSATALVVYAISSLVAGFVSARLYLQVSCPSRTPPPTPPLRGFLFLFLSVRLVSVCYGDGGHPTQHPTAMPDATPDCNARARCMCDATPDCNARARCMCVLMSQHPTAMPAPAVCVF